MQPVSQPHTPLISLAGYKEPAMSPGMASGYHHNLHNLPITMTRHADPKTDDAKNEATIDDDFIVADDTVIRHRCRVIN